MGLEDLTRAGIQAAVREHDLLGRVAFRSWHSCDRTSTYELTVGGKRYDATVIAAVGHLYATGALLTAEDVQGSQQAEVHRLRTLGFTVEEGGSTEEQLNAPEKPQLILQPRGGPKDHGPQHFARSMRQGIRVSDLRQAVGSEADVLAGLYPDGIARLWGSTPTSHPNNEKVRALSGRRVGDHVLFYAGWKFLARARVLGLFTSSAVARAVWGTDEDSATWEHIMALDDFEEFPQAVPAPEILEALKVPRPLRMLTLRSADDYARVSHFLPPQGSSQSRAAVPSQSSASLTSAELLAQLDALKTHRNSMNGAASRHQPLALLWTIARIAAGKPRLAPWSLFRAEVGALLSEFGVPGSKITPEYPFWHLQGSGVWEVHGVPEPADAMPQIKVFNTAQPVAGMSHEAAKLMQNPVTRLDALVRLRNRYLQDVDQRALLGKLRLAGYTTADGLLDESADGRERKSTNVVRSTGGAERRESIGSRIVRNTALATLVKEIHGHKCQVCETRLQYKLKPYSEAAHVRGLGSPHDGPDELHNMLCLCPNHHVLFDGLEIYVDADDVVRQTHSDKPLGRLRRHVDHPIDEKHLSYHRTLCELNS
ncbi:putative restriction endonuclease [Kitasatospora sp. MAP12-15]|uniref:HNH endonuclease n=1 Tax=unclassified Kitasatospora TaxID=2633591 RepID=UPI002472F6F3|nr:HNH endonuclease [Kitasatospora sp. MAP12-44]MDH6114350.1 putative restriction endonuclease [Kitasatospora sp. MAP12-44]